MPMDLADATLMLAANKLGIKGILTLGHDFHIYLTTDGSVLDVLP
ncbi:MAG: toxin-antitoxin system, toxin component, PIN family protein [Chthonomonadales bacterium]